MDFELEFSDFYEISRITFRFLQLSYPSNKLIKFLSIGL